MPTAHQNVKLCSDWQAAICTGFMHLSERLLQGKDLYNKGLITSFIKIYGIEALPRFVWGKSMGHPICAEKNWRKSLWSMFSCIEICAIISRQNTGALKDILIISKCLKLNHFTNPMEENLADPGKTSVKRIHITMCHCLFIHPV